MLALMKQHSYVYTIMKMCMFVLAAIAFVSVEIAESKPTQILNVQQELEELLHGNTTAGQTRTTIGVHTGTLPYSVHCLCGRQQLP